MQRLVSLDLLRGIAVLGILAINIAGFAGPRVGTISPSLVAAVTEHRSALDSWAFAFSLVFFEGKMRALFSLLFGAGIVLFCERKDAAGSDGDALQARRLFWLMALGMAHYLLLWWGDILFVYAICGLAALTLRRLNEKILLIGALVLFYGWHLWGLLELAPLVHAETALREGVATGPQADRVAAWFKPVMSTVATEMREADLGFGQLLLVKLTHRPLWLVTMTWSSFAETLPLMMIGMVMYRRGFFQAGVSRLRLRTLAVWATGCGLALSAGFTAWAFARGFPPIAMEAALAWGLVLPHLLTALGYAAIVVLAAPRLATSLPGRCLVAAGRMAFSNYVATSLVMSLCFRAWGLGLFADFGPALQWPFVMLAWLAMLCWSPLWLRHFRRGPLEWLWRSLVEAKPLQNRR
ncbi:DUF418 domain-containing protein [Novosphingobium sp. YJ-S2-02]|uniref:DUF418 domain-containing protein n=1 Tax=Novosphingobium aureum TaxID=2792964 RepID=A0A931MKH3_9SPHN|nr:DUF418 domain-containing protein [Novosphingobium aureum]